MELRYYTDTLNEYNLAKLRLKYLLAKKEELYVRYLGVKSPHIGEEASHGNTFNRDKIIAYLSKLQEARENGLSLNDEIDIISKEIDILESIIESMTKSISSLEGIEGKLYYEIVVNNRKPTDAVKFISESEHISEPVIWHKYYSKIKNDIKRLKK